jgi:ABC-type bacteriocin/lantibiotic exporter with double-glycine peptidase domain
VLRNELSVGELVAFMLLTRNIAQPITKLATAWENFQEALSAVERLNDVFETSPELPETRGREVIALPRLQGHVRFEALTFRYESAARENVLQNVTLEIEPGQRIAFVGRSGSGKSTLLKLLLGLYPPSSGSIYVDGFNVEDVWLPSLRRQIGVVPQQSYLFRGTIRDNIACGRPDVLLSEIVEVAKLAGAHEFITRTRKGYDTMLEEQGLNISGGERQRIAIARALLGRPRILVLDEATSALDAETERLVQRNLDAEFRDATVLMIAHRLSTIRSADVIVVLDKGVVVEQGTHAQLMSKRGLYYHLNSQQLNI